MATPAPSQVYQLQAGTSADLAEVMEVMEAAFGDTYGEGWTRSQIAGILPMAGVSLVLARVTADNRCAGFSLSRAVADEAELLLIAVDPRLQRRGVGRRLMDRFLAEAQAAKLARVHLEVRDGNPAVAMYREMGFEAVGRRRDYYTGANKKRHDAITLARSP